MKISYIHGYDPRENIRLQDQASTLVELLHSDTSYLTFRAIRCVRRAIFPSKSRDVPHSVSLTTFLAGLSGFCFVFFSCLSPAAYGSGKSVRK